MQTKTPDWSKYQRLVQQSCAYLSVNDENGSLLKLSLQLATLRLTLPDTSSERLKQHAPMPVALQQIEVILLLCKHYGWPDKVCHLLLQAGFCSVLCQAMPQRQHWPKLQHFPALLAARLLHSDADTNPLQTILAGCYPTERNIAPWRQNPLSLLLTQAEYLRSPRASLQPLLGRRIALSKSEYELQLLRRILACLYQPQHENDMAEVDFFNQSQFAQLYDADTSTLEQYLQQDPHLAAPVLARASQLNRQRQQISNLHLALNLLGRAQIPAMLAEAELHYNLSRWHHPQQALLQQFSTCLAQACDLLLPGQHSRSYWQALALCLCAPLWRDL
ncbi:MAG TPA: hypothetical protein VFY01_10480, partial [Rheinheimera sp.]|nr:hypothetical protein [Rheinheimera sp.]